MLRAAPARSGTGRALSITQIAFDLAFTDSSYFGRCFKRQFGITPGDYRRQMD